MATEVTRDSPVDLLGATTTDISLAVPAVARDRSRAYLSARALLVFVFLLLIFTVAARQIIDPDFWWHLKTGQLLVETRSLPHTDIYSVQFFGKEWITHEWLAEILIYLVYRASGFGGLIVTFALLITAGFAIAYRRCASEVGHPYVAGAALLLGALAAAPTWGVRPQVFSFLLASVFLTVLTEYQKGFGAGQGWAGKQAIWWLVPLMVLWVNLHAGFAMGIVLILLTIIGIALDKVVNEGDSISRVWRLVRPLCFVLLACVAAVLLNPNGARLYSYPFETLTSQAMMKYIEEWRSPDFHELMFQPLALLILSVFAALALSSKRIRLSQLLLLLATGWAALRSGRNVPFFVLVAMPLLAEHSWDWLSAHRWGQWLNKPEKKVVGADATLKIALNILLLVAAPVTLAAWRVRHSIANQSTVEAQAFPAAAVEFTRARSLPQPVFNEYGWGGYLIWKLYPTYRVNIDGRADVYGDVFIEEFLDTHDGGLNWKESLNRQSVRTLLLKPDAPLASLLREDRSWQKVFEDNHAIVFVRL